MRAPELFHSAMKRVSSPINWGLLVAFCLLWTLVPWSLGLGVPPFHLALAPLHWGIAILLIFPLPWQWTGDQRPLAPLGRGLAQAVPWNLLWGFAITLSLSYLHHGSEPHHPHPQAPRMESWLPYNPKVILGAVGYAAMGLLLGWLLAQKERAEAGEDRALRMAGEARMHVLQSQMNPHVLFNAISGISEMVREEPEAAEGALLNLSSLLRDLLDYGAASKAPLSKERAMVERYLSLEQIRLGKRLRVSWDWDPTLEALELPPLMLQPLVENALKHGIAPQRGGGELRITLRAQAEVLELEVANTGAPLAERIQEGVGLGNLRERLAFFQPGAEVHLDRNGDWTHARISLGRPS